MVVRPQAHRRGTPPTATSSVACMGDDFVSMGGGRLEILLRWECGTEGDTSKLHTRPEENDMRWLPPLLGVQPCIAQMARQPRIQQQARGNKMEKDCINAQGEGPYREKRMECLAGALPLSRCFQSGPTALHPSSHRWDVHNIATSAPCLHPTC